jgi:hypothetical protein
MAKGRSLEADYLKGRHSASSSNSLSSRQRIFTMFTSQITVLLTLATAAFAQQAAWGQCGGKFQDSTFTACKINNCEGNGYSGQTTCVSGYTCKYVNDWYSQCQPGSAPPSSSSTYTPPPTSTTSVPGGTQPTGTPAATGLHAAMVRKGKQYFGSIADSNLLNNAQNVAVLKREFGVLTPENSMKWDQIECKCIAKTSEARLELLLNQLQVLIMAQKLTKYSQPRRTTSTLLVVMPSSTLPSKTT